MKNKYKIDYNHYDIASRPYALYCKPHGLFKKWEFTGSFKTKEEAVSIFNMLTDLPVYLN